MLDHRAFVRFAALFEAAVAVVAILVGWAVGVRPEGIWLEWRAFFVGGVATLPLLALYLAASRVPLRPLRRIHELLLGTLGKPLAECRWHELALLATLAGICEELLFRGVLQPWIGRLGETAGWVGSSLLFGLAHAVTPTYLVLATCIGSYLSGVLDIAGGNLLAPMLTHALYDWFAFVQLARDYRRLGGDERFPQEPLDGTDGDEGF